MADTFQDPALARHGFSGLVVRLRGAPLLGVLANIGSRAYIGGVGLVVTPLYVRLLGLQSYGLVGIFSVVTSIAFLLDLGLSATVTRELSKASGSRDTPGETRGVIRTFEVAYWTISISCGMAMWVLAPTLTRYWVSDSGLPPEQVTLALRLMGCTLAFAMPISMYSGALVGLRRIGLLSSLNTLNATVKNLGALAAMLAISATSNTFFVWQGVAAAVSVLVLRNSVYRALPASAFKSRFDLAILRRSSRFTADMSGVSIISIITHNADKIVLAGVIPLAAFGTYSLAVTFSSILLLIASAVYMSTIAQFTAAIEADTRSTLRRLFKHASDLLCILVCPAGAVMVIVADRCMEIATGSGDIPAQGVPVFCLASLAALVNALSWPCYTLLVGAGRTRAIFKSYAYGAVALVPLIIISSLRFGLIGAAVMMVVSQILNLTCMVWIAHHHRLTESTAHWFLSYVVACNAVALLSTAAMRAGIALLHFDTGMDFRAAAIIELGLCYVFSLACTGLYILRRRAPVAAAH